MPPAFPSSATTCHSCRFPFSVRPRPSPGASPCTKMTTSICMPKPYATAKPCSKATIRTDQTARRSHPRARQRRRAHDRARNSARPDHQRHLRGAERKHADLHAVGLLSRRQRSARRHFARSRARKTSATSARRSILCSRPASASPTPTKRGTSACSRPASLPRRKNGHGIHNRPKRRRRLERLRSAKSGNGRRAVDPKRGFVVAANNRPIAGALHTDEGDYDLQGYWQPPYRATRITELLSTKDKWSRDDLRAPCRTTSSWARRNISSRCSCRSWRMHRTSCSPRRLGKWDLSADIDAPEPLLYSEWRHQLLAALFADEMGEERFEEFSHLAVSSHALERALSDPSFPFWDDARTREVETPEIIAKRHSQAALDKIAERTGTPDLASAGAGVRSTFPARISSRVFARKQTRRGLVQSRTVPLSPAPAKRSTIETASYGEDFKVTAGPSTRRLLDFADLDHPLTVLPTGEFRQFA